MRIEAVSNPVPRPLALFSKKAMFLMTTASFECCHEKNLGKEELAFSTFRTLISFTRGEVARCPTHHNEVEPTERRIEYYLFGSSPLLKHHTLRLVRFGTCLYFLLY